MLAVAKSAMAKCKPWVPSPTYGSWKKRILDLAMVVDEAAGRHPGEATVPAQRTRLDRNPIVVCPKCSGCGEEASNLRKCSGCRAVAYYSRACQLRHWKEGGHKQQCVQLAAGSAEAGSSTRGGH